MKLSNILTINAIIFIALGIAFAVYGPLAMAFLKVPELDIEGITYWPIVAFGRMFGAALFGFGFLIWSIARTIDVLPGPAVRNAVRTLFLGNLILVAAAISQQAQVFGNLAGLLLTAVFVVFSLIYLWIILRNPQGYPA